MTMNNNDTFEMDPESILSKYEPKIEVTENENPEYAGMRDRVDKITDDGETLDIDSYKRYVATYDITVFVDNDSNEAISLENASCIFLAKDYKVARLMCLNELVKQSQYEFVCIKDAIFKSLVCLDDK